VTDELVPDPASSEPPGPVGDTASEDELDAILAEAASLSDMVAGEVGTPEDQHSSAGTDQLRDKRPGPANEIDAEFADLEDLLDKAGREISGGREASGENTPPNAASQESHTDTGHADAATDSRSGVQGDTDEPPVREAESSPEDKGEPESTDDASGFTAESAQSPGDAETVAGPKREPALCGHDLSVPDFMSEFMEPEPEADDAPPPKGKTTHTPYVERSKAGTAQSPATPPKGASGTASLRRETGARKSAVDVAKFAGKGSLIELDEEELRGVSPRGAEAATPGFCRRAVTRLTPLALPVCECGARIIEVLDRPTRRLGEAPRLLIGWLAIATVGTSVIVYLISMF